MKLLSGILIIFLLGMTLPAHAGDQEVPAASASLSSCTSLEKPAPSQEAGIAGDDAYRLRKEEEHEQTLQALRACQSAAIALEGAEKELDVAREAVSAQSDALRVAKEALDQHSTMIDFSGPGTSDEQKQLRADFNRDAQAYSDAVSAFERTRDLYAARVEEQNHRRKGYDDRCADLVVLEYDMEAVCGESDDWFCRSFE